MGLNTGWHVDWHPSLLVLPPMLLAYKYCTQWIAGYGKTESL